MLSLAAWILTGCGVALVLIGVFFLAARPPLLPEDARVMGSTVEHILEVVPALSMWLRSEDERCGHRRAARGDQ